MKKKENMAKLFFRYSIPSIFAMWVYSLYTMVDGVFIGRYVGPLGLASVNLTMPLINFMFAMGIMIAIGSSTLMAISYGAGDWTEGNKNFTTALAFLVIFGFLSTSAVLIFLDEIVRFLGGTGELFQHTKEYLRTVIIFSTCFMCGYAMEVYIRLDGNPTFPMISVISGGVLNVILDYIFIAIFHMGIRGAALATGLAQITMSIILLTYILKRSKKLKFIKVDNFFKRISKIIYTGLSEFLAEVSTGISIYFFNIAILKEIGDIGVSAFGIISYVTTFVTMAMIGLNQGLQPIVSLNLGKKNFANIKKVFKIAVGTVIVVSLIFYLIINLFTINIVEFFIKEKIAVDLTKSALRVYSIGYLLCGINILIAGFFTSINKVKQASFITALRGIILIVILIQLLSKFFGETGLWLTVPIAETLTLIVSLIFLKRCRMGDVNNEEDKCNERVG